MPYEPGMYLVEQLVGTSNPTPHDIGVVLHTKRGVPIIRFYQYHSGEFEQATYDGRRIDGKKRRIASY